MRFGKISRLCFFTFVLLLCINTAVGRQDKGNERSRAKARHLFMRGAQSEANGNYDAAYEFYKRAHNADPSYPDASFAYGFLRGSLEQDTFLQRDELIKDMALMQDYVDKFPKDLEATEKYAYTAAMADSVEEALRVVRRAVALRPGVSRLYMLMAYYYSTLSHHDSAVYAIREFERLEGANQETTIRKVGMWLARQDTVAALNEARVYENNNPDNYQATIDRAMIYNILGRQDSAIIILEEGMRRFPDNSPMRADVAMMYAERGDTASFHKLFDEAFHGKDLEYEDHMALLAMYLKSMDGGGDFTESDKLFRYAETLYSKDADFYDLYADYEGIKKDPKAALEKVKKALELNPGEPAFLGRTITFSILADMPEEGEKAFENFPDQEQKLRFSILLAYISALQLDNKQDEALEWCDVILQKETPGLSLATVLSPEMVDSIFGASLLNERNKVSMIYEIAGDLYARDQKSDDAVRSYENAVLINPFDNPSAYNNYAYYILETIKAQPGTELFEKAKEMSRKSIEQSSQNPSGNYYDTYAWFFYKEGNYKEALTYQEIAMDLEEESNASELYDHYGDILFMNGREEDALKQWEKALELSPENEELKLKIKQKEIR